MFSLSSSGRSPTPSAGPPELGFTDVVVHWPREQGIYAGDVAVLEAIAPG